MANNKPTEYSVQELKNLSADVSVSPPIPREGMLIRLNDGSYVAASGTSDGAVNVNATVTSGDNVQYTEGDVDATPTGTVPMWRKSVDDSIVSVSDENPLPVSATLDTTGLATLAEQQTQTTHLATIAGDTTDIEAAVELIDDTVGTTGAAIPSKGIAMAGTDGTNTRIIKTDANGEPQVDVLTLPAIPSGSNTIGAVEVDGTALGNGQVSVDTTSGGVTILAASAGRKGVIIKNQGSVTCYIGTGSVTTSNGLELKAGESVGIETDSDVKGITASSSTTVGYLSLA